MKETKREGDGATPVGTYPLRRVLFRADRLEKPVTALPVATLCEQDALCDDVALPEYNTHVTLSFSGSHERLWREDNLYDLVVVVGYNDNPPVPGKGSAIFLHVARPEMTPTAGCIAFRQEDLLEILRAVPADARIEIVLESR